MRGGPGPTECPLSSVCGRVITSKTAQPQLLWGMKGPVLPRRSLRANERTAVGLPWAVRFPLMPREVAGTVGGSH